MIFSCAAQSVDKPKILFLRRSRRIFRFSADMRGGKTHCKRKIAIKLFFKNTGVVLAGIECSPKIFDFRASGIPVQERGDLFDTLKKAVTGNLAGL